MGMARGADQSHPVPRVLAPRREGRMDPLATYSSSERREMLQGRPTFSAGLRGKRGEQGSDLVVDLGGIVDRGRDLLAESLAVAAAQPVDSDPHGPLGDS